MYTLIINSPGEAEAIIDGLIGRMRTKIEALGEYGMTLLDTETRDDLKEIVMLAEKCMEIIEEADRVREKFLSEMEGK